MNVTQRNHMASRLRGIAAVCAILATMVCLGASNKEADQRIQQALDAAKTGNLVMALPLLERAERYHPLHAGNYEILYQLGLAYIEVGKPDLAKQTFDVFVKRFSALGDKLDRNDDVTIALGRVMAARKEYDKAIAHIRSFIETKKRSKSIDSARITLASILMDQSKLAEARKYLEPIVSDPTSPIHESALFLLAEAAAREGKYDQTEVLIARIIKNSRDRGMRNAAFFKRGDIYRDSSNIVKALQAFRRIKVEGNDSEARTLNANVLFEVAQTFEQLGHPLEARLGYEGVAKLYGTTSLGTDAWYRAILCDAEYGDIPRAEEMYTSFITRFPTHPLSPSLRLQIGEKCAMHADFSNAVAQFKAGLAEFPTGEWAEATYSMLGQSFLGARRYDDAERTLKDFAAKYPKSDMLPQSFYTLAETYVEQKRFANAIEQFATLAKDYAANEFGIAAATRIEEVKFLNADALLETNKLDEAIAAFEKITATNLVEAATLRIADAHLMAADTKDEKVHKERLAKAAEQVKGFLARFTNSSSIPEATIRLGDIYAVDENYDKAEPTYASVLAMNLPSTNELLPYAKLRIAECRFFSPSNDVAGATNAIADLVENYPRSMQCADALNLLADIRMSGQEYGAASEAYARLAEGYPTHMYAHRAAYRAGEMLLLNQQNDDALPVFTKAFSRFPDAWCGIASLLRAGEIAGEVAGGATNASRLAQWMATLDGLSNGGPVVALARAGALMRAGDGAAAQQACANVNETSLPKDVQGFALAIKAGAANAASNFAEGARLSAQAVQSATISGFGLDEAYYQRAYAFYGQKQWKQADEAFNAFEGIIANEPLMANRRTVLAMLDHAQCRIENKDGNGAVDLCDQAPVLLKGVPDIAARASLLKGDARFGQENYKDAAQYYRRVVKLYKRMKAHAVPAYRGLIASYTKLGLTEDVKATAADFAVHYPAEAKAN